MGFIMSSIKHNQLSFDISNEKEQLPNISFLNKHGIKPSPLYNTYWNFAYKRQEVFFSRFKGNHFPWTDDDILIKYKFTNSYRASDRVSQYLISDVIYCKENYSPEDLFFRIILFKVFNKIETWEYLIKEFGDITWKDYSFEKYDKVLSYLLSKKKIYSAAYIMPSGTYFGFNKKHRNNLKLIEMMMRDHITAKIASIRSLKDLYLILLSYPSIGNFLSFQYAIDLNYSELCDFSEMDYVVAGPGAISGIKKCFLDTSNHNEEYIIHMMSEYQEDEFHRLNLDFKYLGKRKLQLIDCQNLFCETDKYTRVAFPDYYYNGNRKRIKQLFKPNINEPIKYKYPPKWNVKL